MRGCPVIFRWLIGLWSLLTCLYGQGTATTPAVPAQPLQPALPGAAGPPPGVDDPGAFQDPLAPLVESGGPEANHGRFPVKIVGGRLVAHCEISTRHRRIPANLFIDLESPSGLQLHSRAAENLKAENEAGERTAIFVHFPEFQVRLERREEGPEKVFEEFTRLYSREIGEDALIGALGAKFFKDYAITLDLARGFVHFDPPEPAVSALETEVVNEAPPEAAERVSEDGVIEVGLTTTDEVIWVPVETPDGAVAAMALATAEPSSLIDEIWCDDLGHPAGDVRPLRLGGLNLSERVAFRPAEIRYVHEDGAIGVLGLDLLRQLRVEIDHARNMARMRPVTPAEFPAADQAFYEALIEDDPEIYETFLWAYPEARHSQEAARRLLHLRIDEDAVLEDFERAVTWQAGTWREDIRSTRALDLVEELREAGYPDAALKAGALGVEGGRDDRYPDSVHHLHYQLGDIQLKAGEDKQAWRHLLSAAFGMPENGLINLRLGNFYERQGRYQRAQSRYLQAVIDVESGEEAVAGLERVTRLLGEERRLSVDRIERMIAGKIYGYTAATRFRPEESEETNRVALVEFFTNAHIKHPARDEGALGGALGNEGLLSHFPRSRVAMLAYHLPHPRLAMDSLTNEVAQARADACGVGPNVQLVNGTASIPGVGHARDAEKLYKLGREVVKEALKEPSELSLGLEAAVEGDVLSGEVTVRGPRDLEGRGRVHLVLAERGVVYPGRSKVIVHRMVARAELTRSVMGQPFAPGPSGDMVIAFERSLREIEQGNAVYLDQLQADGAGSVEKYVVAMDPDQLTLVAFVRDAVTGEVLQALQIDPQSDSSPDPL